MGRVRNRCVNTIMPNDSFFNPAAKTYYYPIEVALRWCGLLAFEVQILSTTVGEPSTCQRLFPQWPCLAANLDKLHDAIRNGELRYGCLGRTVEPGTRVEPSCLTVRHHDLKIWMAYYYPDQKPDFLFDPVEQTTHNAVNVASYQVLQADREALKNNLAEQHQSYQVLLARHAQLEEDNKVLQQQVSKHADDISERSETTHLNIIGSLLQLLLGHSPAGNPYSSFHNQTAVITTILAHHRGRLGITERTLERKFAAARRSLNAH